MQITHTSGDFGDTSVIAYVGSSEQSPITLNFGYNVFIHISIAETERIVYELETALNEYTEYIDGEKHVTK